MSLDGDIATPSTDRYQPQHVVVRQHVQLRAPAEHLHQTGNGNRPLPSRDDDVIVKMASEVTSDVINCAVRACAAAEQAPEGEKSPEQYSPPRGNREPTGTASDAIQLPSTTQTSSATSGEVEDRQSTAGNETVKLPPDVAAAVSNCSSTPETLSATSGDGPEAEALQDIARLQALTRQLRAAVAESRSADGLPVDVDDSEIRTSSKDLEQQSSQKTTTTKDNDDTEDGEDGFTTELISQAKQSRSEKKARKALCKLGLKPVNGVAQVTIRRKKNSVFVISRPDVYVSSTCETYVVFGEARIDDPEERAKQEAAKNLVGTSAAPVRTAADSAADNEEQMSDDDDNVDETGISAADIEIVMSQAGVSRSHAVRALRHNDNDVVNALMALTT